MILQRHKEVSVWRYDEDGSDDAVIPWQEVGNALFEMGVYVISIHCGRYDSKTSNGGQESETGVLFDDDDEGSSGKGRNRNSHGGDTVVEDTARGVMLTFTVDGRRDVGEALEQACDCVNAGGCFGEKFVVVEYASVWMMKHSNVSPRIISHLHDIFLVPALLGRAQ